MQEKQNTIDLIVSLEFHMFQHVQGTHGKASCQSDPATFRIMRASQFTTWSNDVLTSYYDDLEKAKSEKRNMLAEKYAFMMESTHPEEFANILHSLPSLSDSARTMRESIIANYMLWEQELIQKYPRIKAQGRPSFSKQDIFGETSVETYLRGEFSTYSETTLKKLVHYTDLCKETGRNLAEETLLETVKSYGFCSIQDAETQVGSKK